MKKISIAALCIILLAAASAPKWNLEKEKDGIKVYLAKTENLAIKQFKAEAFVAASPQQIADAVVDLENNYKWFINVQRAQLIKRISASEFVFSQIVEVPFPYKNRQVVQTCKTTKLANGVVRLDLKEKNDALPVNDEFVRMQTCKGYWILTPVKGGTQIEYSFVADPSGNIPAWLANQFIVDNPFETIKGLRAYLSKN